jgi:hypothetical protein
MLFCNSGPEASFWIGTFRPVAGVGGKRNLIIGSWEQKHETDKIQIMVYAVRQIDGAFDRQTCHFYVGRGSHRRVGNHGANIRL